MKISSFYHTLRVVRFSKSVNTLLLWIFTTTNFACWPSVIRAISNSCHFGSPHEITVFLFFENFCATCIKLLGAIRAILDPLKNFSNGTHIKLLQILQISRNFSEKSRRPTSVKTWIQKILEKSRSRNFKHLKKTPSRFGETTPSTFFDSPARTQNGGSKSRFWEVDTKLELITGVEG